MKYLLLMLPFILFSCYMDENAMDLLYDNKESFFSLGELEKFKQNKVNENIELIIGFDEVKFTNFPIARYDKAVIHFEGQIENLNGDRVIYEKQLFIFNHSNILVGTFSPNILTDNFWKESIKSEILKTKFKIEFFYFINKKCISFSSTDWKIEGLHY